MACNETAVLAHGYIDDELDEAARARLDRHLASCAVCRGLIERERLLSDVLRRAADRPTAPPALAARIARALDAAERVAGSANSHPALGQRPVFGRRLVLGQGVALVATLAGVAVLSSLATRELVRPDRAAAFGEELIGAHVRSLMAEHLTDVASSDRHTVKPWFNGRVDLSPPVRDLTGEGFPLIGGRLDYVDRRAVAVLIYKRQQHVINLFVLPALAQSRAAPAAHRGYNLRRWMNAGQEFWAVSDVNTGDLARFEQVVRAATAGD